ncbi:PocR sensory domain-containing protein [Oscillibacter sp. PC13]|uniref:helix-turn-helix domain-containing protein n=1 Tax=Oscillibacter sp. PC13 TaxID=1855299 RepID=UPI0008EB19E4|nr:helix-turn-helix domain-containing protein [Oscillibacter sp. PC13]SFP65222.1 PocR sensory domain-containing protein [Oscillibacter sp. PC13]
MLPKGQLQRCQQCCQDIRLLCGVDCRTVSTEEIRILRETPPQPDFCDGCSYIRCRARATHAYGCNESYRWHSPYLYYCPLGLAFVAQCICTDAGELEGGIAAGPFLTSNREEAREQVAELTSAVCIDSVPQWSGDQSAALGRLLEFLCRGMISEGFRPPSAVLPENQGEPADLSTSLEGERQLQQLIEQQDSEGARGLLDQVFSQAYAASGGDTEAMRHRVMELSVMLARACVNAGADVQEVFGRSDYLTDIREFSTVDQLYSWITSVLRRFMDYTFEFQQVRHANALFNAQRFIRQHYAERLTLESIAAEVCLSPGYLSSLFKAEAGESLFAYLNRFRVKRSRQLLLESSRPLVEVAHACGFEDQSYFTRVFKKYTGVSPGKFRQKNGRV